MQYIVSAAKKYQNQSLSFYELISEGYISLTNAIEMYPESQDNKFISWVKLWILEDIKQALAKHTQTVGYPTRYAIYQDKTVMVIDKFEQIIERPPPIEELIGFLDMPKEVITSMMHGSELCTSFNEPLVEDNEKDALDLLEDDYTPPPDSALMYESLKHDLNLVFKTLSERERKVVKLFFGIDQHDEMTLEQISKIYGLTGERVRQIKEKAIRKMRHITRRKLLYKYLG